MEAIDIARALHAHLREQGYPYVAPTIHTWGAHAYLRAWGDQYPAMVVIAIYTGEENKPEAAEWALRLAQRDTKKGAPCGVVACIATDDLEIVEVE